MEHKSGLEGNYVVIWCSDTDGKEGGSQEHFGGWVNRMEWQVHPAHRTTWVGALDGLERQTKLVEA